MRRAAVVGLVFVMLAGACSRTDDASISGEPSARGEDAAAEDGSWTILQYSMADNNPDAPVEVTDTFVAVIDGVEQYGAGATVFRPEDTELRDAYNEHLADIVATW